MLDLNAKILKKIPSYGLWFFLGKYLTAQVFKHRNITYSVIFSRSNKALIIPR